MLLILVLLGAGITWGVIDRYGGFLAVAAALFVAMFYLLSALFWLSDRTGVNALIVNSWVFFSGVSLGTNVVATPQECGLNEPIGLSLLKLLCVIALFFVAILNAIVGLVAVVGTPVGIVASCLGAFTTLITGGKVRSLLVLGLGLLTLGLAATIGAGLILRVLHEATVWTASCSAS